MNCLVHANTTLALTADSLLEPMSLGRTALATKGTKAGSARDLTSGAVVSAWAVGAFRAFSAPPS